LYRICICDDDSNFIAELWDKIKIFCLSPYIEIEVTTFNDGNKLIESGDNFDLIFLDIQMPRIGGFEVAEKLNEKLQKNHTILIFCSSHENLVFESFDYQPFNFLRKNIMDSELPDIIKKLIYKLKIENCEYSFHDENGYYILRAKEIKYINVFHGAFEIYTSNGKKHTAYGRIGQLYKTLDSNIFIRIHRSYIVNCKFISKITFDKVILDDGETSLHIGRTYLENLRKTYDLFTFGDNNYDNETI
jgi:DNA-binding LytR/AlgR family response regulator